MGSSKIFFFHDRDKSQPHQSNKSCAIAGETEVAEQRLSPVQFNACLQFSWSDIFFVDRIRKETDRRKLGNSFQNGSPTWRRSHQPEGRQIPAGGISALEHNAASSQVAGKKLEAQLQSCIKQTRAKRQSLTPSRFVSGVQVSSSASHVSFDRTNCLRRMIKADMNADLLAAAVHAEPTDANMVRLLDEWSLEMEAQGANPSSGTWSV